MKGDHKFRRWLQKGLERGTAISLSAESEADTAGKCNSGKFNSILYSLEHCNSQQKWQNGQMQGNVSYRRRPRRDEWSFLRIKLHRVEERHIPQSSDSSDYTWLYYIYSRSAATNSNYALVFWLRCHTFRLKTLASLVWATPLDWRIHCIESHWKRFSIPPSVFGTEETGWRNETAGNLQATRDPPQRRSELTTLHRCSMVGRKITVRFQEPHPTLSAFQASSLRPFWPQWSGYSGLTCPCPVWPRESWMTQFWRRVLNRRVARENANVDPRCATRPRTPTTTTTMMMPADSEPSKQRFWLQEIDWEASTSIFGPRRAGAGCCCCCGGQQLYAQIDRCPARGCVPRIPMPGLCLRLFSQFFLLHRST